MKLGLGSVSMIFDILFMIQHFILYPNHEEPAEDKLITEEVESLDLEKRDFVRSGSNRIIDISVIKTP